tara:strand:- start:435 stop:953 length:519 start_codon:yes stop_codon:yes gene_type:complete
MAGAMQLDIEVRPDIDLEAAFKMAPEIVVEELTITTYEAELLVQREVQDLTPVGVGAGGGLRGSIGAQEPIVNGIDVVGRVSTAAAHAVPVELGTRPHFPPVEPLIDWVVAKLGIAAPEAAGVAWRIALKISRKGTEGAHMFERGLDATRGQVLRMYEQCMIRIGRRLGATA